MKALVLNQQQEFRIPKLFLVQKTKFISSCLIKMTKSNLTSDHLVKHSKTKLNNSKSLNLYKNLSATKSLNHDLKKLELNLVFVEESHIQNLNKTFRGLNKPTDVLSFTSEDPQVLGELIFCPTVITENAKSNGWSQKDEYLYMLIHGILHLLGHDHETPNESQKMFKLQDTIFNQLSTKAKVI